MSGIFDLTQMWQPPAAPALPQPGARKPSILDRVLSRLFPAQSEYAGVLSPELQRELQGRALTQASLGLLANAGSGRGTFANVGKAIQDVNFPAQLAGTAQTLSAVQDRQKQIELAQRRSQIVSQFPPAPGETLQQTGERLTQMLPAFMQIGDLETVGKLTELLKSMGLGGQHDRPFKVEDLRGPDGKVHRYRVFEQGPPEDIGEAPPPADGADAQRGFTRENALADDFGREIAPIRDARQFIDAALQQRQLAKDGDGAAQVQLLYAFVKAMDPTSVVREGEVALARQAQTVYQRVGAKIREYEGRGSVVVPPELVDQISNLLERRIASYDRRWRQVRDRYLQRARRWQIPADAFEDVPTAGASGITPGGGGTARNQLDREYR